MMVAGEAMDRFDYIEARLIEAVRCFSWFERLGGSSWATDGPWYLSRVMRPDDPLSHWVGDAGFAAERDRLASSMAHAVANPRPDRDMITRAEEAFSWLMRVDEADRPLVLKVITLFAAGKSAPWAHLADANLRGAASRNALRMRYKRAVRTLSQLIPH